MRVAQTPDLDAANIPANIPAQTIVGMSGSFVHDPAEIFKNPKAFNPDPWLRPDSAWSALDQRSVPEQHQIRSFARSLCHNCDNLYKRCWSLVNKESDVRHRQNHEELDGDLRVQDDVALKSASENSSVDPPIKPAGFLCEEIYREVAITTIKCLEHGVWEWASYPLCNTPRVKQTQHNADAQSLPQP
jgi:hypothetical protein